MSQPTTSIGFSPTTPAAPAGYVNTVPQSDGLTPFQTESTYVANVGGVAAKTANYTAAAIDNGTLLSFNSSSAVTLTLPAAPPFAIWKIAVQNIGAGVLTVNRNSLNIDGAAANVTLTQGNGAEIFTDGTNYFTERGSTGNMSPLTTKGDLYGHSTLDARIPVGSDGQILVADSTQTPGVKWAASTTLIFSGTGSATATAGNDVINLGSTPNTNSVQIFADGARISPADYGVSGTTVRVLTPFTGGQVIVVDWLTTNATPGGIALSTAVVQSSLRGTGILGVGATTTGIGYPTGTVPGDFAVLFAGRENAGATTPTGWTQRNTAGGSFAAGYVYTKILTGADLSAGTVSAGADPAGDQIYAIATFAGSTGGFREADMVSTHPGASPVTGPSTSGAVLVTDFALLFSYNRASPSTNTCNQGTLAQNLTTGTSTAVLYTDALTAGGAITPTFTFSTPGTGYYLGTVIIEGS